jgi:hypothetical protein
VWVKRAVGWKSTARTTFVNAAVREEGCVGKVEGILVSI